MGAQIEDGQIAFVGVLKGVGHRGGKGLNRADGAVLDGEAAKRHVRADERGTDQMQIAGDRRAEIGLGDEVRAGEQQRVRLPLRKGGGKAHKQARKRKKQRYEEAAHGLPSFHRSVEK